MNGGLLISFCSVQDCSFNTFNLSEPACRLAVIRTILLTWCSTEYVGCYKDSDPRDLPQRLHDREVTVRSCVKNCKDLFYRYAGIQFSYLCFCGNKRGRYGQLPEWKCSSECASKKDEHCGGYWSNSIYKTGAVGKLNSIYIFLACKTIASLKFSLLLEPQASERDSPRGVRLDETVEIQAKQSPNLKGRHLVFISGERKLQSCKLIVENLFLRRGSRLSKENIGA